jgi:hypothetical protein
VFLDQPMPASAVRASEFIAGLKAPRIHRHDGEPLS